MTNRDVLFARTPVAPGHRSDPVVVVGLPRSGSSYLSHVLSSLGDWFVFDDLYLLRQAKGLGVNGPCTPEQLERLVFFLGWQVRARLKHDRDFVPLGLSLEDVDGMCDAVLATFRDAPPTWTELLEEWLVRLALHHDCAHWGWKAPQDFLHTEELKEAFPGLRMILILRDPRAVLASFKYLSGEDGTRRQYHPLVYARYWRLAETEARAEADRQGVPLHVVRFESLTAEPDAEARRLAEFLGTECASTVPAMGANTSFRDGARRRGLTPTETWLCERIAGDAMRRQGYAVGGSRPRLRDLPDLAWTSLRFATYQAWRLVRDPAARHSVASFARRLAGSA